MNTLTAYKTGSTFHLERPPSGGAPITLILKDDVRVAQSAMGVPLLYRSGHPYGMPIAAALQAGWCRVETPRSVPTGHELRIHPRCARPPVQLDWMHGVIVDLSQGGLGLVTSAEARAGERRRLRLIASGSHDYQEAEAEVMWRRGDRTGFRWVDLTAQQHRWIQEQVARWG